MVSAELIYEDTHETYRNVKINDRPTDRALEEIGGSWSTGEFATTLLDLFHPDTDARFQSGGASSIAGFSAQVYDFEVPRERSHWMLHAGSQTLAAAYGGSVWVNAKPRASCESRCRPATYRQISRWIQSSPQLIIRTSGLARHRFCFRSMLRAWVVNGVPATAATTSRPGLLLHLRLDRPRRARRDQHHAKATLRAVADHAQIPADSVRGHYAETRQVLRDLEAVGVDYGDLTEGLRATPSHVRRELAGPR